MKRSMRADIGIFRAFADDSDRDSKVIPAMAARAVRMLHTAHFHLDTSPFVVSSYLHVCMYVDGYR